MRSEGHIEFDKILNNHLNLLVIISRFGQSALWLAPPLIFSIFS